MIKEFKTHTGAIFCDTDKNMEWLYQRQVVDLEVSNIEKFVNEFKKAMEGGVE